MSKRAVPRSAALSFTLARPRLPGSLGFVLPCLTGPNFTRPEGDQPYGADFPVVTVGDMVEVQKRRADR